MALTVLEACSLGNMGTLYAVGSGPRPGLYLNWVSAQAAGARGPAGGTWAKWWYSEAVRDSGAASNPEECWWAGVGFLARHGHRDAQARVAQRAGAAAAAGRQADEERLVREREAKAQRAERERQQRLRRAELEVLERGARARLEEARAVERARLERAQAQACAGVAAAAVRAVVAMYPQRDRSDHRRSGEGKRRQRKMLKAKQAVSRDCGDGQAPSSGDGGADEGAAGSEALLE